MNRTDPNQSKAKTGFFHFLTHIPCVCSLYYSHFLFIPKTRGPIVLVLSIADDNPSYVAPLITESYWPNFKSVISVSWNIAPLSPRKFKSNNFGSVSTQMAILQNLVNNYHQYLMKILWFCLFWRRIRFKSNSSKSDYLCAACSPFDARYPAMKWNKRHKNKWHWYGK